MDPKEKLIYLVLETGLKQFKQMSQQISYGKILRMALAPDF